MKIRKTNRSFAVNTPSINRGKESNNEILGGTDVKNGVILLPREFEDIRKTDWRERD